MSAKGEGQSGGVANSDPTYMEIQEGGVATNDPTYMEVGEGGENTVEVNKNEAYGIFT